MARYTRKYLLIYAMQACSILLGMVSLFIVIPYLSSNKELYGIYAVCSSLTIFFSYADIGFVAASLKYTSEAYAQGKNIMETQILGFSCLVLLSFLMLISAGILFLANTPAMLIEGIKEENIGVAQDLLLILALSSPVFCFQRIIQVFFMARLSDYVFQFIQIIGNVIKILSVFIFFNAGEYNIVGYYLSFQLISLICVLVSFVVARKYYNFKLMTFVLNIKYNKSVFQLIRGLAFASLFSTLCWVLFYEIDNIVISKIWGAEAVALYAIAFSILSLFRTFLGMVFSPFTPRLNYFVGEGDIKGLNQYVKTLMELFLPICVVPILVFSILAKPYIYSWVGSDYEGSVSITSCLLLCNILAFMSYPSNIYISSLNKIKYMYISNVFMIAIYWGGIFILYKEIGLYVFAMMKTLGMIFAAIYGFCIVAYLMKESIMSFLFSFLRRNILPIMVCVIISMVLRPYLFYTQGKIYLLYNLLILILACVACFVVYFFSNSIFRSESIRIISSYKHSILRR